jgi:hypothetical protein
MTPDGMADHGNVKIELYKCGCGSIVKQIWEVTKTVCYDEDGSLLFVNFPYEKQM